MSVPWRLTHKKIEVLYYCGQKCSSIAFYIVTLLIINRTLYVREVGAYVQVLWKLAIRKTVWVVLVLWEHSRTGFIPMYHSVSNVLFQIHLCTGWRMTLMSSSPGTCTCWTSSQTLSILIGCCISSMASLANHVSFCRMWEKSFTHMCVHVDDKNIILVAVSNCLEQVCEGGRLS